MAIDLDWDLIHENIEEYVNDENKIVTCKWLSLTLNFNINVAKRALHEFVRQQRKKNGNGSIHVTYFLAGLGTSKSGELEHKCIVLPEIEVDAVKKSLSVITSCHVYSVQKANLKDYIPLYLTDSEIIKQNLSQCASQSSIKCGWVDQRAVRQPTRVVEKQSTADKHEKNVPTKTPSVSSNAAAEGVRTVFKKAEPKGSIASMFAAAGQKKGTPEVPPTAQAKASDAKVVNGNHKTKPTEKKRGVLSFFANGDTTKKSSPVNVNSNDKKQMQEKIQEKRIVNKEVKSAVESDDEPEKKRRKRIRTDLFDSSDEDGESEDGEMEQELRYHEMAEDVDNENPVPAPDAGKQIHAKAVSVEDDKEETGSRQDKGLGKGDPLKETINGGGRKRKRTMKTVVKHYLDEEGFMVSKKESVWESESEEEAVVAVDTEESKPEIVPIKQNNRTSTNPKVEQRKKTVRKKSTTSPNKAKQTSLTSFFKK